MKDNSLLKEIFNADQKARVGIPESHAMSREYWSKVALEDKYRLNKTLAIISGNGTEDETCS